MLLTVLTYWHWYIPVYYWPIARLNEQNEQTHGPYRILKMSVKGGSTIIGLASLVQLMVVDFKHS
jgi:hypothetical protein